ncbi:hypothetical protein XENOCAPTIV_023232 [Xenoophorus captivus]|uniref:Uncharacterized protein n=1 Tax=Xenoophorus captivus TaxID=1517983 RepID=A0ABV0RM75_9TELE
MRCQRKYQRDESLEQLRYPSPTRCCALPVSWLKEGYHNFPLLTRKTHSVVWKYLQSQKTQTGPGGDGNSNITLIQDYISVLKLQLTSYYQKVYQGADWLPEQIAQLMNLLISARYGCGGLL